MEIIQPSQPWADNSQFQMVYVGQKEVTFRRAVAQGKIHLSEDAFFAVRQGRNPKGNVLALAEVAGIIAAKKTSDLIPLCHPLPLEQVKLRFELNDKEFQITVFCEVSTHAKTGVEMEALSGVNGALLAIYDLSKAVHPEITISEVRLNLKEGGKSGRWVHPDAKSETPLQNSELPSLPGVRVKVITLSDRAFAGTSKDTSGPAIADFLAQQGCDILGFEIVPDEKRKIQSAVLTAIREEGAQLVITTGGTGLGPRDVTPEAIEEISDRVIPGFGECLRKKGAQTIEYAWLSRSMGALIGKSLVIALPGSKKAVLEGLDALQVLLPHALQIAQGGNHD